MTPTVITSDNPLAPRWMRDSSCPEETPTGFRDQFFEYPMNFIVPANLFQQNLYIVLDKDADFVLRQLEPTAYQAGHVTTLVGAYRFKDGFGHSLSENLVTAEVHGPIFPELVLPKGTRFFVDFDNTQNAFSTQVAIILRGCKRFKL
jgi:hypothetical protein